jgi:hypothetical protein
MAASRGGAPRIQASQSRAGKQPDEHQEIFGKKEAFWVPDLHRTFVALALPYSRPITASIISGKSAAPYLENLCHSMSSPS